MLINLNILTQEVNKRFTGNNKNLIVLELCDDNQIRVSKGDVSYYCDHAKLMKILKENEVDYKDEAQIYDTLAKHLSNQLSASIGRKVHPEIASIDGDNI